MPPITFPNQRMVRVHREAAKSDFLGIKNENWQAASRDLGAHALQLYLYLASNANNYTVALSPVAVRQAIGMARSTYHDQFHKLVDRGYLVQSTGNTFEFYEVPQAATQTQKEVSANGLDFEESPPCGNSVSLGSEFADFDFDKVFSGGGADFHGDFLLLYVAIKGDVYITTKLMYVATRFQEIQKSRCSALKTAGFALQKFRFYSSQLCQTF